MTLADLWAQARKRKLGRIEIADVGTDERPEWKATSPNLKVPHDARGATPIEALFELVNFVEELHRPWWRRKR